MATDQKQRQELEVVPVRQVRSSVKRLPRGELWNGAQPCSCMWEQSCLVDSDFLFLKVPSFSPSLPQSPIKSCSCIKLLPWGTESRLCISRQQWHYPWESSRSRGKPVRFLGRQGWLKGRAEQSPIKLYLKCVCGTSRPTGSARMFMVTMWDNTWKCISNYCSLY